MTEWHKLSPKRQTWMVYRVVRKLEPNAQIEKIRDALMEEVGVRMKLHWCRIRLNKLTEFNNLRTEVTDGVQIWFANDGRQQTPVQVERSREPVIEGLRGP